LTMYNHVDAKYRILVVDDDEILNDLFCAFLGARDFETISALSVEQAKNILIQDDNIDLVLLDYQLGDGVGLDLLDNQLVVQYPSLPPVIMISANEAPEFLEKCFVSGVADYIIKPVNLSLLALKVKALVNSVRLQRIVSVQKMELEKFKIEAEREETIAKFTYEYLLSQNSQAIRGIKKFMRPCSSFSGDIAISRISPNGDLYLMLADATGHGLSAAITIMPIVTIFNSMVAKGFHLQQIVTEINRKLVKDTPDDRFVAAIVLECNFLKKEVYVWNGSMPSAYWVNQGKIEKTFDSKHMALGILDAVSFDADISMCSMPDTGYLVLYSDGLIEQENIDKQQFSVTRLQDILSTVDDDPIDAILPELDAHAQGVAFSDDVSICTLDFASICHEYEINKHLMHSSDLKIDPFSWSVKISGRKLAQAELPPMVNNFLQYIGLDQKRCQKVFSIISEMVSNGLDHGILKLSSDIKQKQDGFMEYFLKRDELLNHLSESDFIELRLDWLQIEGTKKLMITCRDSGQGYDYSAEKVVDDDLYSGRGLALIRSLVESLEIYAPGNFIKVIL
jgi:two-component system, HptB-dependent secretion and biofilm response regulator